MCGDGGGGAPPASPLSGPDVRGLGLEFPPHQEIVPSWGRLQELVGNGFEDIKARYYFFR